MTPWVQSQTVWPARELRVALLTRLRAESQTAREVTPTGQGAQRCRELRCARQASVKHGRLPRPGIKAQEPEEDAKSSILASRVCLPSSSDWTRRMGDPLTLMQTGRGARTIHGRCRRQ